MYRMWYTVFVRRRPEVAQGGNVQSERFENEGKRVPAIIYPAEAGGGPKLE